MVHWTDKHIKEKNGQFYAYNENNKLYSINDTYWEAKASLIYYEKYILNKNKLEKKS